MRVVLLLLLVTLITIKTEAGGKNKKERTKHLQSGCTDWRYGNCVPSNGDCGPGFREGSCDQQTMKMKCKVPCSRKKESGGCKYRFSRWEECDPSSHVRTKTGTLKNDVSNPGCEPTLTVSKPCPQNHEKKYKRKNKGKKKKGKGN